MTIQKFNEYKPYTLTHLHKIMTQHYEKKRIFDYSNHNCVRDLIITPIKDDHGKIGSYNISLSGSPPKGYAIYVPGHSALWIYDAWGKRWRDLYLESHIFPEILEIKEPCVFAYMPDLGYYSYERRIKYE